VNGVSGRRADTIEMRNESGANGGIGEVALYHVEFALSVVFSLIKLDALVFYCLEFTLMHSIPINVSDNTGILEIYDSVVDEKSRGRGRMKYIEVVIFDPRAIEVWGGVCTCVERNGVFGVALLANSYKVSIDSDLSEGDISCNFVLPILIEEDKGVLPRITAVVLAPSKTQMIWVVQLYTELGNVGDGARCGRKGNGRVIRSESHRLFILDVFTCHVPFNLVKDLRNEEKVLNGGVVAKGSGEDLIVKLSVPQDIDCREEVLRPR